MESRIGQYEPLASGETRPGMVRRPVGIKNRWSAPPHIAVIKQRSTSFIFMLFMLLLLSTRKGLSVRLLPTQEFPRHVSTKVFHLKAQQGPRKCELVRYHVALWKLKSDRRFSVNSRKLEYMVPNQGETEENNVKRT